MNTGAWIPKALIGCPMIATGNTGVEPLVEAGPSPLAILEHNIYRGPSLHADRPMIRIKLDLGALQEWPTDRLPGFADRVLGLLPGLARHGCCYGRPLGFVERLRAGTWLGHVIEHVALELQVMVGYRTGRGKTRSVAGYPGHYNVLYAYEDEGCGVAAGSYAIQMVSALLPDALRQVTGLDRLGVPVEEAALDVEQIRAKLRRHCRKAPLGPTTRALVDAARRRRIPVQRLDNQSLIQFGYGRRQKRIRASITGETSLLGAEIAGNKQLTRELLALAGLPVPRGGVAANLAEARLLAQRLGWPVVVKPQDGNHGRGVTTSVAGVEMLEEAFALAEKGRRRVIVEQHLPGSDHRILVVAGKIVAVAQRQPPFVTGDGRHSIRDLVAMVNADPARGQAHENMLTRITCDDTVAMVLARAGMHLDSVPSAGQSVLLRDTANLSSGGTATDRTGEIHPFNASIALQAAAMTGLDVCGIDFLCPDIARPIHETGGGIVEVNAAPGLRMHLAPTQGESRDVAGPIIDALFPGGAMARIPIVAITGTNGKSTTVRMVGRILRRAGHNVGMTTTSGLYHNEHLMKPYDATGPKSARAVLANPLVDVAVLETARGGILREGLGFDRCDVGAVLNVAEDHLGLKGIDTLEQMADLKAVVPRAVHRHGYVVLNADDPMCRRMAARAGGQVVWFSMCEGGIMPGPVKDHVADGGMAALRDGEDLVLCRDGQRTVLIRAADIPATHGGTVHFNIANALAAAAICSARGVPPALIRDGLASFASSFEDNPGRLNIHDAHGIRFLVDYAHNPAGLRALGDVIAHMRGDHARVLGMVSIPGDRRDSDIAEMGRLAAGLFDEVVFRETSDGRGRARGEINAIMTAGALEAGMDPCRVRRVLDEDIAAQRLIAMARPGDLVVLLPTSIKAVWEQVLAYRPDMAAAMAPS
ncbi:cyanophycin synthetase [Novosphingobium sediminicola]|uniref:Cyanophycin synthetase n=2 Tax=Novosphingobium sediminicola TaxID=563162 RepID=A0A7W6CK55_9SPHN|nr:cyanophycin synthetase [Novosphingobium sediminicola]